VGAAALLVAAADWSAVIVAYDMPMRALVVAGTASTYDS
jgi:hypothetical protein